MTSRVYGQLGRCGCWPDREDPGEIVDRWSLGPIPPVNILLSAGDFNRIGKRKRDFFSHRRVIEIMTSACALE